MEFENEIIRIANSLKGSDPEFFFRVWNTDREKYGDRLKMIGYTHQAKVLDAGFGMGQWLVKLSELNEFVCGVEYSIDRVHAVEEIIKTLKIKNASIQQGSIESLPYSDNEFDAVFCYGVIFCTNYRKSLKEFLRVLKPGGKLYFTANDLGWFLFCLIEEHNKSKNYDPRTMAIETIQDTIDYYLGVDLLPGHQLIIKRDIVKNELYEMGFNDVIIKSEGTINFIEDSKGNSFYNQTNYMNQGFIYEVIATKK